MKEFAKSLSGFTLGMSLFSLQLLVDMLEPSETARALDSVTHAATDQLGSTFRAAFRALDNAQRGTFPERLAVDEVDEEEVPAVALDLLAVAYVQVVYLQARMFNLMVFCVVGALAILWSRAMHSRPRVNFKRSASFAQP